MKVEQLQVLGETIRQYREQQGYTQKSFAQHVKIDRSYMGFIERGERNINTLMLIRIAMGLGVTMDDLFKGVL